MNTDRTTVEIQSRKVMLSALWVFVMFNYLYCDYLTNLQSSVLKDLLAGHVAGLQVTQGFMLGGAFLMEIPIVMILLAWVLKYRANRWANVIAGAIMTVVQTSSLFIGTPPTLHYVFYSIIEIACTLFIAWYAWAWPNPEG